MIVAALWPKHAVNLGTLARTCEAIGADLLIPRGFEREAEAANTCLYQPLTVKDPDRWLKDAMASRRVLGVETGGAPIGEFDPDPNVVLVLGHESNGIPRRYRQYPAGPREENLQLVSLPQFGRSPCINVATAGSIAAYHFSGLLRHGGGS